MRSRALLSMAIANLVFQCVSLDDFDAWVAEFQVSFRTASEMKQARANYELNGEHVKRLNSFGDGAKYSLASPFAHLRPSDFIARLMPARAAPSHVLDAKRISFSDDLLRQTLESFDWTSQTNSPVSPFVRDQGALGSCWAISATENIEGQYALATGKVTLLSSEQLVECDASIDLKCGGKGPDASHSHSLGCADCGMFGGWPYLAYQYLERKGGVFSMDVFPYSASNSSMYPCMPDGYDKTQCGDHDDMYCNRETTVGQRKEHGLCKATDGFTAHVSGWKSLSTNETELAAQLIKEGPLSVLIKADNLQFYHGGVWRGGGPLLGGCKPDPTMGVLGLDHAVLLVGFGMDGGTPYWRLKNSWGTTWGEQGYFKMLRGSGTCGVNSAATTAIVTDRAALIV